MNKKIIICDDDYRIFKISQKILPEFDLTYCESGEKCIETLSISENLYSVVFIDVWMDGIDGCETADKIQKINKNIEIVLITAHDMDCLPEFNEAERILFLKKPFDKRVMRQMALCLNRKWILNREINKKRRELVESVNIVMDKLAESVEQYGRIPCARQDKRICETDRCSYRRKNTS